MCIIYANSVSASLLVLAISLVSNTNAIHSTNLCYSESTPNIFVTEIFE